LDILLPRSHAPAQCHSEFFKLDLFAFNEALDKNKELNSKVRDYVRQNSEKLHKQLELMEQKE